MNSYLWRLTLRLKRKSYIAQIFILFSSTFVMTLFVLPLLFIVDQVVGENTSGPDLDWWVGVIILIPILETYLNQHFPFKLMQKWSLTRKKYGLYIVISALAFALLHCYSLRYIILVLPGGFVLGYVYIFYSKNPRIAFWSTTLIHALKNSVAILTLVFEK